MQPLAISTCSPAAPAWLAARKRSKQRDFTWTSLGIHFPQTGRPTSARTRTNSTASSAQALLQLFRVPAPALVPAGSQWQQRRAHLGVDELKDVFGRP